jgi:uncharacterized protein YecT (DUF1311 family)
VAQGLLDAISKTPLANVLVLAGILFWVLAIAGSLAGKITVDPGKQKIAGILGTVLFAVGMALYLVTPPSEKVGLASPDKPGEVPCDNLIPRGRERPSFNCAHAQAPIERLICADADLAHWDGEMSRVYVEQLDQQKTPEDKQKLTKQQHEWMNERDDKCDIPDAGDFPLEKLCGKKDCILSLIKARLDALAQAPQKPPPI